ncbi:hypothetical protein BDY17DRAFT_324789 [Neohortaea acidophila]|uniref:G-protein coupled receptors family 2 profile 2 domain-containing protein n=1 Tax=Neohortaea acidophila TaxID=245834 RepID=A0A6A6PS45_9PEZI|nr:uncharacterized protein BDY17DRAFT_324789 [Neohortaea acidophila]KAF2482511.1 hypothetical protein BDY17DRAFT_324789 [Neohortaea acidophila]
MANTTMFARANACPPPFLDSASFPSTGGFIEGRFCSPISDLPGSPECCLPCPATAWAYSDGFYTWITVIEWLNVAGLILLAFMLLSYLVLPVQQTRKHYLSVCLIVSVMMLALGFTIPLATNPEQCYNDITPNDMYTLTECAWSGAFIVAGGLSTGMWIFIRALSMNLQICWDIVPGQKFFYYSQAFGWGIPAVLFTVTMTFTGVSFRFGRECDVNHDNSMKDFWGPLMGMVGLAGILQLMTFVHCLRVYLRNLFTDRPDSSTNGSSTGLPSYSGSTRTQNQTARVVWRRLQKVLWLQWRGIAIVTVIVVDVVFFSIVFVWLDGLQNTVTSHFAQVEPWIECLVFNPTAKDACLHLVGAWLVNQATVTAVLLLISLAGLQIFLFVARPSIFPGWWHFFRSKFTTNHQEFVSLDARRSPEVMRSNSQKGLVTTYQHERGSMFEMQRPGKLDLDAKTLSSPITTFTTTTTLSSPDETYKSPLIIDRNANANHRSSGCSSLIGRGRIPQEFIERLHTPEPTYPLASPPTPVIRYDAVSLSRQDADYFPRPGTAPSSQQQRYTPSQRPQSRSSMNSERRYRAPESSFSAPYYAPSRHSSVRSARFGGAGEQRDAAGVAPLNPPVVEARDDESGAEEDLQRHLDRKYRVVVS